MFKTMIPGLFSSFDQVLVYRLQGPGDDVLRHLFMSILDVELTVWTLLEVVGLQVLLPFGQLRQLPVVCSM